MTDKYDSIINEKAEKYDVDPKLIKAMIQTESGFDPNAKSSAGAQGLMQLMPSTFNSLMGDGDPYDPEQNIEAGTKYISQLLKENDGDTKKALASYNAGSANVEKYGAEKYSSYYNKVLSYYDGSEVSGGSEASEKSLKWWGDIVIVVFSILLLIVAVVFLVTAVTGGNIPKVSEVKKKFKKAVKK